MSADRQRLVELSVQVSAIVHEAVVAVCGRELLTESSAADQQNVLLWREELQRFVGGTITVKDPSQILLQPTRSYYDIEIRTATALRQRYSQRSKNTHGIANTSSLTLVSEMGVVRRVHSAYDLASLLLLPALERAFQAEELSHHVRVSPQGFVLVASDELLQQLQSQRPDLLPCPTCHVWCKGTKGLQWHLQRQHELLVGLPHVVLNTSLLLYQRDHCTSMIVFRPYSESTNAVKDARNVECDPWSCVKCGSLPDLQRFLAANPDFDCASVRDTHGAVLLHWAAGGGHLAMVQYLVERRACTLDSPQTGKRAFKGRTALHWAARHGHLSTVRYLLDDAAKHDVDGVLMKKRLEAATADGTTAFCWAAWQGHLNVMKLLFACGAMADTTNQFGCNAVLWAAQGDNTSIVPILEWLDLVGCSLRVVNNSFHGLLSKSAQRGRRDVCEWFLEKRLFRWITESDCCGGVLDLVGPDSDGCTPSDLAGMEGHAELAAYLAAQEQALVAAAAALLPFHPPTWLTHIKNNSGSMQPSWKPRAGVLRMRSVLRSYYQ